MLDCGSGSEHWNLAGERLVFGQVVERNRLVCFCVGWRLGIGVVLSAVSWFFRGGRDGGAVGLGIRIGIGIDAIGNALVLSVSKRVVRAHVFTCVRYFNGVRIVLG